MSLYAKNKNRTKQQKGFSTLETIIAVVLFIIFAGIATFSLTQGLRTKNSHRTYLELQQNMRTALQQLSQDVRAATKIGPWNDPASGCDDVADACSRRERLSILTTTGRFTDVAEQAGSRFANSTQTYVCDARGFHRGDLVLLGGNNTYKLIKLSGVRKKRNYSQPCSKTNRDILRHRSTPISGAWDSNNFAYQVQLVIYQLIPDPLDPARTVLYRRVGSAASPAGGSGIVAFDINDLKFSYGVPMDPAAVGTSVQRLRFYDSLSAARSALGSGYTDNPNGSGIYVGKVVRAIRVSLAGTTPAPLKTGGKKGHYELTETIDLR